MGEMGGGAKGQKNDVWSSGSSKQRMFNCGPVIRDVAGRLGLLAQGQAGGQQQQWQPD